jgi:hypothetical protein
MKSTCSTLVSGMHWLVYPALCLRLSAMTISLGSVSDTSLFENKPDSNLGATTLLAGTNQQVSKARGLFLFDLSSLPAGAVVTEVQVQLYCTRQPDPDQHGGPVASDFSLYRMYVGWGEGGGASNTGSAAAVGDATWNERHYAGISWGTPGGLAGSDYANNPSATTSVGNIGMYVWGSSNELIADVQSWIDSPETNFGFMLASQSEASPGSARRFASREQPGGLIPAPQLIVTYSLVPEPSYFSLAALGLVCVSFRRQR